MMFGVVIVVLTLAPLTIPLVSGACPTDSLPCGGNTCYKSSEYVCINPSTNQLCPVAYPLACDQACYNPAQFTCTYGVLHGVAAPGCVIPGDVRCGNRCYNPNIHVCADAVTEFLCPIAQPNRCGTSCYNSEQYSCQNEQLQPAERGGQPTQSSNQCPVPGTLACGTVCYNPTIHVCSDSATSFLCPVAAPNKCGQACYAESHYSCFNGALIPAGASPTQAPTSAPTEQSTAAPTSAPTPIVCPEGFLRCGEVCYNWTNYVCVNAFASRLCPVQQRNLCGFDECYDFAFYSCINGTLISKPTSTTPGPTNGPAPPADQLTIPPCPAAIPERCSLGICYDPSTIICVNFTLGKICAIDNPDACFQLPPMLRPPTGLVDQACLAKYGFFFPNRCGTVCYTNNGQTCVRIQSPSCACGNNDEQCIARCSAPDYY